MTRLPKVPPLVLAVLLVLGCDQTSKSTPTATPQLAPAVPVLEQVTLVPNQAGYEFLLSDGTSVSAYQLMDQFDLAGLESRVNPTSGFVEVRPIGDYWIQVEPAFRSPLGEILPECSSIAPDLAPDYQLGMSPSIRPSRVASVNCSNGLPIFGGRVVVFISLHDSTNPSVAEILMRNGSNSGIEYTINYYLHPQWHDDSVSWMTVETARVTQGWSDITYQIMESATRVLVYAQISFDLPTAIEEIPAGVPDVQSLERVQQLRDAVKSINMALVNSPLENRPLRLNVAHDTVEHMQSGIWVPLDPSPIRRPRFDPLYNSPEIEVHIDEAWWPVQLFPLEANEWTPGYFLGLADLPPVVPGKFHISTRAYDELIRGPEGARALLEEFLPLTRDGYETSKAINTDKGFK